MADKTITLACCAWALSAATQEGLTRVATMGFNYADLRPQPLDAQPVLDLPVPVSCVAASFGQPQGSGLDRDTPQALAPAQAHIKTALDQAATWGASTAYLVPEADARPAALKRYGDSLALLAEYASARNIKLALEHFPGCSLPTAAATLAFVHAVDHPNLYLLLDLGHLQISAEDPVKTVETAGQRLAYVHLDDNDGRNDLHVGLLDGVLTQDVLQAFIGALAANSYKGSVSLELNAALEDPAAALERSRVAVARAAADLGLTLY